MDSEYPAHQSLDGSSGYVDKWDNDVVSVAVADVEEHWEDQVAVSVYVLDEQGQAAFGAAGH
jgi:hypothetical protein